MSAQDRTNWLRDRIRSLKKASGYNFDEDLFIAILLCLMGREKHLLLRTDWDNIEQIRKATLLLCSNIFGLTTGSATCQESTTITDILAEFYTRPKQGYEELSLEMSRTSSKRSKRQRNPLLRRSTQGSTTPDGLTDEDSKQDDESTKSDITFEKREKEQARRAANSGILVVDDTSVPLSRLRLTPMTSSTSASVSASASAAASTHSPVSTRRRSLGRALSQPTPTPGTPTSMSSEEDWRRGSFPDLDDRRRRKGSGASSGDPSSRKVVQAFICADVEASLDVQSHLVSILTKKQIIDHGGSYILPSNFVLILICKSGPRRPTISSPLLDQCYLHVVCGTQNNSLPPYRRNMIFKQSDMDDLRSRVDSVHVDHSIYRYASDIAVGLRMHRLTKSGVTMRSRKDHMSLSKALSVLFGQDHVPPIMLITACDKCFAHRIDMRDVTEERSLMWGSDLDTLTRIRKEGRVDDDYPSDRGSFASDQTENVADPLQDNWSTVDIIQEVVQLVRPPL